MILVREIDRENIENLVKGLDDFEKDKAIKSGLRSALNIFRVRGRSNLRERLLRHGKQTGHLMNSFTTRIKRRKLGGLAGFDRPGGNHAHLVDAGTQRRYTTGRRGTRKGMYRGVMPGNRFWQDAEQSESQKAMNALYAGIQRAAARIDARRGQ